jgi:uncharacterized membrane protein
VQPFRPILQLISGIAWIGASFYFIWLDNHLVAPVLTHITAAERAELLEWSGSGAIH